MDKDEMLVQILKSALENHAISFAEISGNENTLDSINAANRKQIIDFIVEIRNALK